MSADREALVDAFLSSLRALLLAGLADERAPPATADRSGRTLRVKDVAALYGVRVKAVYNWINRGVLPVLRFPGGDYRFRSEDLAEFDRRREQNWAPAAEPVALTLAGQAVPITPRRGTAFESGRRAGRARVS
jgi:excisionase family DNA binding protein